MLAAETAAGAWPPQMTREADVNWTTELPTVPGWYWSRVPGHAPWVGELSALPGPLLVFASPQGRPDRPLGEFAGNEFAGPIPPPPDVPAKSAGGDRSTCPECGGTGKGGVQGADPSAVCDYCQGRGWVKWS